MNDEEEESGAPIVPFSRSIEEDLQHRMLLDEAIEKILGMRLSPEARRILNAGRDFDKTTHESSFLCGLRRSGKFLP